MLMMPMCSFLGWWVPTSRTSWFQRRMHWVCEQLLLARSVFQRWIKCQLWWGYQEEDGWQCSRGVLEEAHPLTQHHCGEWQRAASICLAQSVKPYPCIRCGINKMGCQASATKHSPMKACLVPHGKTVDISYRCCALMNLTTKLKILSSRSLTVPCHYFAVIILPWDIEPKWM